MKRAWIAVAAAAALGGCAEMESEARKVEASQNRPQAGGQAFLREGTQLMVQLDQPLGATFSSPGERFTATVTQAVLDDYGQTVIAPGAKLVGHVAEVRPPLVDQPGAIALAVDAVNVQGYERPLRARIVGADVEALRRGVNPSYAGGEIGAGVGAVLAPPTASGGATTVSLGMAGAANALPAGTALAVRLDEPVSIASLQPYRG